ncbi:MAG: hypothetical protein RMM17_13250 [Acidobacteriota bacterium]|nr:hypothetical protein [Blastocatellia bacterium]MDW8413634.1 hypothetical protein [Acidobacteriota bacterium]
MRLLNIAQLQIELRQFDKAAISIKQAKESIPLAVYSPSQRHPDYLNAAITRLLQQS